MMCIIVTIRIILSEPEFKTFDKRIVEDLEKDIIEENKLLYNNKGYKMFVGKRAVWLEIWKKDSLIFKEEQEEDLSNVDYGEFE